MILSIDELMFASVYGFHEMLDDDFFLCSFSYIGMNIDDGYWI